MVKIISEGLAKANHPILKGNNTIVTTIRFAKKKRNVEMKNKKKKL